MIVAVTGGAGFLGQHLVGRFVDRGDQVRVLDTARRPAAFGDEVDYRCGNVLDGDELRATLSGADVVIHAAFAPPSESAARLEAVNARGPRQVADTSVRCGVRRLVLISSTIVERSLRPHPVLASAPLSRLAAYRATRVRGEAALEPMAALVPTAIVRPKTFLGPGRLGGFALAFTSIRTGGAVPIAGPGSNRYQYVHVDDLADGLVRLADTGVAGVFHFGATAVGTVREELLALIDHAGTGARALFLPAQLGRAAVRAVELAALPPLSEFHHAAALRWDSVVDTCRARRELGWSPAHTNLETLVSAYDWYHDNAQQTSIATHPVPVSHRVARRLLAITPGGEQPELGPRPSQGSIP